MILESLKEFMAIEVNTGSYYVSILRNQREISSLTLQYAWLCNCVHLKRISLWEKKKIMWKTSKFTLQQGKHENEHSGGIFGLRKTEGKTSFLETGHWSEAKRALWELMFTLLNSFFKFGEFYLSHTLS